MTDRPIIFSAPMVCALLEGRKTMTRRLAWVLPKTNNCRSAGESIDRGGFAKPSLWQKAQPGDRLYVRENFTDRFIENDHGSKYVAYAADGLMIDHATGKTDANVVPLKMRPSIHMPRWASRLTLVVTAVKIERLWNISDDDAKAEGFLDDEPCNGMESAREKFADLWEQWIENPEIIALTFSVHRTNIDKMPGAA